MERMRDIFFRVDPLLFLSAFLLSVIGMAAIWSVGLAHDPPAFGAVVKQGIALGIGIVLAWGLTVVHYRRFDHLARALYLVSIALLVLVLFAGSTVNGTRGWFLLAGWGVQPVELAKIALALLLARFMDQHADMREVRSLLISGFLTAIPTVLVLLQPDFGSAMVLIGMWACVVLFARMRLRHFIVIAIGVLVMMILGWTIFLKPYQKERIRIFLDPARAPLAEGYNTRQATIAIGAGGFFGRGLGFGSQSQLRFIPEAQTDFLFAVVGEELGFIGIMSVFFLYTVFLLRALRLIAYARENFTAFFGIAGTSSIFLAVIVNAGMNLGLLPVTGIALPFLSAGGSSLLTSWVIVGMLGSISARSAAAQTIAVRDEESIAVHVEAV